jgi:hypothetical protein
MRTFGAIVAALFGAVLGFFIVGFLSCLVAVKAESIPMAFVAIALAIAAAIGGGYLGARLALGNAPPHGDGLRPRGSPEVVEWLDRKDEGK